MTHLRSVWLHACIHQVLRKRIPFEDDCPEDLDTYELERRTKHAIRLHASWTSPDPKPNRIIRFTAGPVSVLADVRLVRRHSREWLLTITEGIWPMIDCWELTPDDGPIKVGEWSRNGASIRKVVVNSDAANDADLVVSVEKKG